MAEFTLPADLIFNRRPIDDPISFARETGSTSWLFLVGDEFASMPGGMSYAQVQQAVPHSARVVSDPPRVLTLDLARQQIAALDRLPRPTLISCRSGPRASAVAYLYAGLKLGATVDAVLAAAERDNAPFCMFLEMKDWLRSSIESLQREAGFSSEDQPGQAK